jgi:hypothetical protein
MTRHWKRGWAEQPKLAHQHDSDGRVCSPAAGPARGVA